MSDYRICSRCVMDTSDPNIVFDKKGYCNHCTRVLERYKSYPYNLTKYKRADELKEIVKKIKKAGKNKRYDCIVGISGGLDSSFMLYKIKELGLRPLAIHLDNGWNSELAVKNIENLLNKLEVDLYTIVLNWDEFKDLQLSFLKASVPDLEIPTDHAIKAAVYLTARKFNISYKIMGENIATESILPKAWANGHDDWRYIRLLQKRFGSKKLKSYCHMTLWKYFFSTFIKKISYVNLLDYVEYDKESAKNELIKHINWRPYKAKHGESSYTRFIQEHILPEKFGFDKRRAHLSSLVCSKQISRDEALRILDEELYEESDLKKDITFVSNKLAITERNFKKLIDLPNKFYSDYPSYDTVPLILWGKKLYMKLGFHRIKKKELAEE